MTTQKIKDQITFSCDKCPEVYEPARLGLGSEPREWSEVWEDAKRAGWRALKNGSEWEHLCPSCERKGKGPMVPSRMI